MLLLLCPDERTSSALWPMAGAGMARSEIAGTYLLNLSRYEVGASLPLADCETVHHRQVLHDE
jgi:hypothetical protein